MQDTDPEYDILVHAFAVNHGINAEFSASIPGIRPGADCTRSRRGNGRWRWCVVAFGGRGTRAAAIFDLAVRVEAFVGLRRCVRGDS